MPTLAYSRQPIFSFRISPRPPAPTYPKMDQSKTASAHIPQNGSVAHVALKTEQAVGEVGGQYLGDDGADKASRTVSLEHTGDEDAGSMLDLIADSQSVSDTVEARATLQFLAKAGKHYRGVARKGVRAIEMQVYGYSTREIAALYGVRSNVVAAWVSRARKMLKEECQAATLSMG